MLYPRRCLFKDFLYRRSVETLKRGVFLNCLKVVIHKTLKSVLEAAA